MTESEKMDLILSELKEIRTDVSELKKDVSGLKQDVSGLKQEISGIKLHLENVTDENIRFLTESQIELFKNLNVTIPYVDSSAVLQVHLNYLTERVTKLEKDFKSKSA